MVAALLPPGLGRALAVGAVFVSFGTVLLSATLASGAQPFRLRALARLQWSALAAAPAALLLWGALVTAEMAQTNGFAATIAVMPAMLRGTEFGHVVLLRLALLASTAFALAAQWRVGAALFAGLAVALQAAHLHALAMHPGASLLLAAEVLHVLAAAGWVGALPALLILVAGAPPTQAAAVARRFSPLGIASVLALAGSAALQAWALIGSWAALFATPYGRVCLAKLILFAALVALAARNRLGLIPRLAAGQAKSAQGLARSISVAAVAGAVLLVLASTLGVLAPGIDVADAPPE
jgi:putative copper resistance protein D